MALRRGVYTGRTGLQRGFQGGHLERAGFGTAHSSLKFSFQDPVPLRYSINGWAQEYKWRGNLALEHPRSSLVLRFQWSVQGPGPADLPHSSDWGRPVFNAYQTAECSETGQGDIQHQEKQAFGTEVIPLVHMQSSSQDLGLQIQDSGHVGYIREPELPIPWSSASGTTEDIAVQRPSWAVTVQGL